MLSGSKPMASQKVNDFFFKKEAISDSFDHTFSILYPSLNEKVKVKTKYFVSDQISAFKWKISKV